MNSVSIADRVFFRTAFMHPFASWPIQFFDSSQVADARTRIRAIQPLVFTKFIDLHWVLLLVVLPGSFVQIPLTMVNGLPFFLCLIDVGKSMDSQACVMLASIYA
jgi:hypothetical protein